jgi:integrase
MTRTSELCALDWNDIDWIREVVVVSRALAQSMDEPAYRTKTERGSSFLESDFVQRHPQEPILTGV